MLLGPLQLVLTRASLHACVQARKGMFEGGIPVGAVLVVDGKVVGRCVHEALPER